MKGGYDYNNIYKKGKGKKLTSTEKKRAETKRASKRNRITQTANRRSVKYRQRQRQSRRTRTTRTSRR